MAQRDLTLLGAASLVIILTLVAFVALVGRTPPTSQEMARLGGAFTLLGEAGETVTEADLHGRPSVLFFGFTHCPDVCPTMLFELSRALERLGDDANKLNVVFVSLDWERDGPEQVARYTSAFDTRIRGLSGSEAQIATIAEAYGVHYERVTSGQGDYTLHHTAATFLLDDEGRVSDTLPYGTDLETTTASLVRLMASI